MTPLHLQPIEDVRRFETDDFKRRLKRLEVQEVTTNKTAGLVKVSVDAGELLTIPAGYQYIAAEQFVVIGDLDIYGELVVI